MSATATHRDPEGLMARLTSRGDLTSYFMQLCEEIGADAYMLVAIVHDQARNVARIIASNWIHDAIELAGRRLLASLAQSPLTAAPGARPRPIALSEAPPLAGLLTGEEARLLDVLGHREIFPLRLYVGRATYFVLFSASEAGSIASDMLTSAQMKTCYALSQIPAMLSAASAQQPLSERERECLVWVAEGKTTEEVAVILGVSGNTINSYVTHAIQKLSASNRAMAIATAIRNGII